MSTIDEITEELTVKRYMSTSVKTLSMKASFREALQRFVEFNTNGLVVLHEDGSIAGILSSWDIIQYIVPDYLEADRHLAAFEAPSTFAERVVEVLDHPITKFMTVNVHTVTEDSSLMRAATLLSEFRIRQLPVVGSRGELVGYINRTDIKRAISDVVRKLSSGERARGVELI